MNQPIQPTSLPNQIQQNPLQRPANPLMKHFRQPVMYIKLTSGGQFWPEGSLELTATGELPVYPMTAKDEIILRTPDALINGTSVVNVIQSCCPNIKDAWAMPSIDVDSTLIAIRIASYGPKMAVSAKCPHCNEEHDYDVDLQVVRDRISSPNYNELITTEDGLTIKLKPLTYEQVSKSGSIQFEEDRLIQALANTEIEESVRAEEYAKHMKKMIELNTSTVSDCTEYIDAAGTRVTDPGFISEYYQNADGKVLKIVQAKMKEFSDTVSLKPEETVCTECQKQFSLNIEFDYTRFFGSGF